MYTVGLHDLAGLAHLVAVGHPAGVDDGTRCTGRRLEELGELLDHLELLGLAEATTAGHDDGSLVELGTRSLLDVAVGDASRAGGTGVGDRQLGDGGRAAAARLGRERLRVAPGRP
jgi:hypothetical protein